MCDFLAGRALAVAAVVTKSREELERALYPRTEEHGCG